MAQRYNMYCDESCHLENDGQKAMILGGIWCPHDKVKSISKRIREIKKQHALSDKFEIKWTKVSPAQHAFYTHLIDYFFDDDDLHFRCLVIPDKAILNHDGYNLDHDEWYYKMYFNMIKAVLNPADEYKIYIDIKDTRGSTKVKKLKEMLSNSLYDFDRSVVKDIQIVRSHEVEILQIADLLIGAISYFYRNKNTSDSKRKIIDRIKERSGYSLSGSTLYREDKFNVFVWKPKKDL